MKVIFILNYAWLDEDFICFLPRLEQQLIENGEG